MSSTEELFIIDTDTGVDDAIAILQMIAAKKSGKVKLLCITAVAGNCSSNDAVQNICRVLDTVNVHDVPVYRGATESIVSSFDPVAKFHGNDGFNDVPFEHEPNMSRVQDDFAWKVISDLSKEYPQLINVVAIGPLTNIALAMKFDPELSTRLKTLFIMGGNIEGIGNVSEAAEFNFHADPEAASIVLRLTRCPTYIASWELCLKYTSINMKWRSEVLGSMKKPAADLINKLEEIWFNDWPFGENWILCDQLAMVAALNRNSIKKNSQHFAQVELKGDLTRGMMVLDQRHQRESSKPRNNVIIIEELDQQCIMDQMRDAFNQ
ncbi:probable uridine nucleosidase 2 [Eurytemora carolleeae]|uniref:probable uridine nucleosidase 2 n=1 Tax=Eurytemora carolleeae TaxID=1294199 RepID=UPI000C763078|nr:probable uridine nucleosidase 2 [Eurytemora carolleeae]|eukprot:XP_023319734.1 probable uridine nucleosidase 2 [Eurytemora affinis]